MDIYYNSLDPRCKSITGAIRQNTNCTIRIYGENCGSCMLLLRQDGEATLSLRMQKIKGGWQIVLNIPEPGLYFYRFSLDGMEVGTDAFRNLIFGQPVVDWQLSVYSENYTTPDWFKGGVMYQIFPDRFYKSGEVVLEQGKWLHADWHETPEFCANEHGKVLNNDFFGGNLKGIIEKLEYLTALGITVLYLNPIFRAYSNHRYDTGDYLEIDPALGTNELFGEFIRKCAEYGIRVILDGVFNHTGDDSRYFNKYGHYDSIGAYQSTQSEYYAWYTFRNFPDKYDSWWGIDVLPAINESCPSYIDFITGSSGVLRHWLRYGIGGWRLDVVDELPDEFVEKIREAVKSEDPDAVVIGEVWEDASNKIAYSKRRRYFQGGELDSVMNYPLKNAIINFVTTNNSEQLRQTIAVLRDNYPKCVLDCLMNILGTHDTYRILTALGGKMLHSKEEMSTAKLSAEQREVAVGRLKAASVLQFTLFGVPCIYYGDEIGMEGYADPFCRYPFAWDAMDTDLLAHYRKLSFIRKEMNVFKSSDYNELYADRDCMIYERRSEDELVVVCVNRGNNRFDLRFDGVLYDLLNGGEYTNKYTLNGFSYCILGNKDIFSIFA